MTATGDLVILYGSWQSMWQVTLEEGKITNNKYGSFLHDDLIGVPYGSKVLNRKGDQWCYLLRPSPEMLTLSLAHRTQIIYHADISAVLMLLAVRPGCVVVEAGTGSGSLSVHLAAACAPNGQLRTFEYNGFRAAEARADFARYGTPCITCEERDVIEDGFPVELAGTADALFLDVPMPWGCLDTVRSTLKPGGRFVSFSPCIEQVQRVAEALRSAADGKPPWQEIRTVECMT